VGGGGGGQRHRGKGAAGPVLEDPAHFEVVHLGERVNLRVELLSSQKGRRRN
jgi:hypothetical protein